jgi:hypothetical protein
MGKEVSPPSQRVISSKLRTLERKGCIKILERSVQGTALEVLLPHEIPGIIVDTSQLPKRTSRRSISSTTRSVVLPSFDVRAGIASGAFAESRDRTTRSIM